MSVVGVGLDLCPVDRMQRAIERHGERFGLRVFTPREWAYCMERGRPWECLAARFAVKEATSKALGAPRGIGWHDVEVMPARSGEHGPSVVLRGKAREVADARGIRTMLVSITHAGGMAAAMAVASTAGVPEGVIGRVSEPVAPAVAAMMGREPVSEGLVGRMNEPVVVTPTGGEPVSEGLVGSMNEPVEPVMGGEP